MFYEIDVLIYSKNNMNSLEFTSFECARVFQPIDFWISHSYYDFLRIQIKWNVVGFFLEQQMVTTSRGKYELWLPLRHIIYHTHTVRFNSICQFDETLSTRCLTMMWVGEWVYWIHWQVKSFARMLFEIIRAELCHCQRGEELHLKTEPIGRRAKSISIEFADN